VKALPTLLARSSAWRLGCGLRACPWRPSRPFAQVGGESIPVEQGRREAIALNRLFLSQKNARKVRNPESIPALAAMIEFHGLLYPLCVVPEQQEIQVHAKQGKGTRRKGGKRWQARPVEAGAATYGVGRRRPPARRVAVARAGGPHGWLPSTLRPYPAPTTGGAGAIDNEEESRGLIESAAALAQRRFPSPNFRIQT
jgi:hypothetical protein